MCVAVSRASFIGLLVWDPPLLQCPGRKPILGKGDLAPGGGLQMHRAGSSQQGSWDSPQLALISAASGQAVRQAWGPLLIISERNATE